MSQWLTAPIKLYSRAMLFALLFSACSTVFAQSGSHHDWIWWKTESGGAVITVSKKYGTDITLRIFFGTEIYGTKQGCSPVIMYSQNVDSLRERLPKGPINVEFQARIDNRPLWQVKKGEAVGIYSDGVAGQAAQFHIMLPVNVEFVVDILEGSTLRFLRVDNGFTDRFSLKGSAVALRNAYALCDKTAQNKTDPDLRYFEVEPQRPSKPKNQDPDRGFFN